MAEVQKIIGLMSGTSLDGVDAALVETDGEGIALPGPALGLPFAPEMRAMLLTEAHTEAVKALLTRAGLVPPR